jgi:hypothetical protein
LQEFAKENMSKGGKGVSIETPLGRINERLAKEVELSASIFSRIETILDRKSSLTMMSDVL